jgi:hypothetical protein
MVRRRAGGWHGDQAHGSYLGQCDVIQILGRRCRCLQASKIEWEIEGIEGSGCKPRVARVLSCGEADRGGSGREGEGRRMTRPSGRAREGVGEGLKRRMVKEGGSARSL